MKVVQLNATCDGSCGDIVLDISHELTDHNIENYVLYHGGQKHDFPLGIKYMGEIAQKLSSCCSHICGNNGFNNYFSTWRLINKLEKLKPDIVHIHNIHAHDCNLSILCRYLKKNRIKTVWTFHDCWAYTGYCSYYTAEKCEKWKNECSECAYYKKYSWFFDRSNYIFKKKKECVNGLDLTIIAPSKWMYDEVKSSFLKNKNIVEIDNGINLACFFPEGDSFKREINCSEKKVVLAVNAKTIGKGVDVVIDAANQLDASYQVVLVGVDDSLEMELPSNIITVPFSRDKDLLRKIYSAADVFMNPTRADVFGLVNVEALACGVPVVAFNTGGVPNIVDETCGIIVPYNDSSAMISAIKKVCEDKCFSKDACIKRAAQFDKRLLSRKTLELYEDLVK